MKVAAPDVPVVSRTATAGSCSRRPSSPPRCSTASTPSPSIFNDGAYGNSNRDQRERFHGREIGTALRNPDFVKFAESFGADAVQLAKGDDVGPALRDALGNTRPSVIVLPMDRLPSPF